VTDRAPTTTVRALRRPSGLWETTPGPRTTLTDEDSEAAGRPAQNDVTVQNDVLVRNDVAVPFNEVAAWPVRRHWCWAVGLAAGPTRRQPSHRLRQGSTPLCLLCCACCSALGDCFSFLCSSPSVLTPFSYSALVPAVSPSPRLDSTLDCVTVFNFAEPCIIDCVALLYHVLSPLSFSVNYCILHMAWLMLNSVG